MKSLKSLSLFLLLLTAPCGCTTTPADITGQTVFMTKTNVAVPPTNDLAFKTDIDSLSLNEAVNLVITYNPGLKTAEKEIDAASARIIQAELLPNPVLFMETEDGRAKSIGIGGGYKSVIGISQSVPLGGKIEARSKIALKEKDIAVISYEQELREIIAQTKTVFTKILITQQSVNNAIATLDVAKKLYDAAQTRVDALAAPQTDLLKADISLSQAEANLTNARTEYFQTQKQLNALLGNLDINVKNYNGQLRETFPDMDKSQIAEAVISTFPESVKAKQEKELAQRQLLLAESERYPDIDIEIGAGKLRETEEDSGIIEWSVSFPLPVFNRNQGRIQEAKALIAKSEKEYQNTIVKLCLEANQTLSAYANLLSQAKIYRERIMPMAEKSLSFISEGYQEGKNDYLELLDAQRTLTETRQAYLGLLEGLNNAAIEIERLSGKSIDELN